RLAAPFAHIAVGGDGLLATSELLARLGLLLLDPLVHLDLPLEADALGRDAEGPVLAAAGDLHRAGSVDQLALIGAIDARVGHAHDKAGALGQRAGRLHGAPFVPGEQSDHAAEQRQPDADAGDRVLDALKP